MTLGSHSLLETKSWKDAVSAAFLAELFGGNLVFLIGANLPATTRREKARQAALSPQERKKEDLDEWANMNAW